MSYTAAENERAREGIVRFGVVTAVDASAARAKVTFGGESQSDWLPWSAERAGTIKVWAPVSIGEQVLVLAPSGDSAQGVIVGSTFSDGNEPPANTEAVYKIELGGSSFTMTADQITLSSNGSTIVMNAAGIIVNGAEVYLN